MSGLLLDNAWTLVARFTSNDTGNAWEESMDIADNRSSGQTPPAYTDAIVTAFHNLMLAVHRGSITLQLIQLYPKRIGHGKLASGNYEPLWEHSLVVAVTGDTVFTSTASSNPLDLSCVAYVRKFASGRDGKIFHRGSLKEGDVGASDGGFWTLNSGANAFNPADYDALLTSSTMKNFFTATPSSGTWYFCVCHVANPDSVPTASIVPVNSMVLEYAGFRHRRRPRGV